MRKLIFILLVVAIHNASCNRKDFLNENPSTDLVVPTTLDDFQKLLDNDEIMKETPVLGELSADNYYLPAAYWPGLKAKEHNAYVWAVDIFDGNGVVDDWNLPYRQIFYANVVLQGLDELKKKTIPPSDTTQFKTIKGTAHFLRGYAFYNLSQVFMNAYDTHNANLPDSGLPLRLDPDINKLVPRSTIQETYDQIIEDLSTSAGLLKDLVDINALNRPNRPAAYAALARVFLSMRDYEKAGLYADSCLKIYSNLMDYNNPAHVTQTGSKPFEKYNREVMYQSIFSDSRVLLSVVIKECIVDSNLIRSYRPNDLRRPFFFTSGMTPNPKLTYSGVVQMFSGLATDEMYLTRAEAYARTGRVSEAIADLNKLLQNRFRTGFFTPYSTTLTAKQAIDTILAERRKELPYRGLRWTDIRRLNKEGANISLTRKINGETFTIAPHDTKFTLPIPPDVLQLGKIPNNIRKP